MKKTLASIAFLLISICAFNQNSVDFTLGFSPKHSYEQSLHQQISLQIDFDSSSTDMISKMEEQGLKNPTHQQMEMVLESLIRTGELNSASGKFPVSQLIKKSETNQKASITAGTEFIGTASAGVLPSYDSVSTALTDEAQKAQMLQLINGISSQFNLPDKKMAVGDTCMVVTPLHVPFGGISLDMDYIAIYHLNAIRSDIAYFDMQVRIRMNMQVKELPITGSGSGSGTLDYDIKNRYQQRNDLKYQIHFRMQQGQLIMHMAMNDDVLIQCRNQKI